MGENMASAMKLYGKREMNAAVGRIAESIAKEFKKDLPEVALVGLQKKGVPLAQRLAAYLKKKYKIALPVGKLDISMYRDDFGMRSALPLIRESDIPFEMHDAKIVLVDDVLSSGRTIRAALTAVNDYGRPELIRLAVLIDREETEYPIAADYVGMQLKVKPRRKLLVEFEESDGQDMVSEVDWKLK